MSEKQHSNRLFVLLLLLVTGSAFAQTVPPDKERYIQRFPDNRSHLERLLNRFDLTLETIGPAYALVVGVDTYPRLPEDLRTLEPAKVDIDNLVAYLRGQERFVEIAVLRNEAVTLGNLEYFLHRYFPAKLQSSPHSRFLLAFTGHGVEEGQFGYFLQPDAPEMSAEHGISLNAIKGLYDRILHNAHQSLVLINACHSGAFLKRKAFGHRLVPLRRGHWAITAGGNASEIVWHDRDVGPGSIFFEKFFAAMDGGADRLPVQSDGTSGDGIITVDELYAYLKTEVQLVTNQSQNPLMGNISLHGDRGSFFFFDRRRLRTSTAADWDASRARAFGLGLCAAASDCLSKGKSAELLGDYPEAAELYLRACEKGEAEGCTNLGVLFEEGSGVEQNETRAAELYGQACDGGEAEGCTRLGHLYFRGAGVTQDNASAAELYRRACDGGEALGCTNLGVFYARGMELERDDARAAALFRQGCEGGEPRGCANLGALYEDGGKGVPRDETRAAELYHQGCEGDEAESCTYLGVLFEEGRGVPQDEARAAVQYSQGCEGGDTEGCSKLALLYVRGAGVKKDLARAAELFEEACDVGEAVACARLGILYLNGLGVEQDEARGEKLLHRACEGGSPVACQYFEEE